MSSGESQAEERRYRVFVGSIPGTFSIQEIETYFSTFGKVDRVRMFYRDGSRLNKGYCHLYVNKEAYYTILSTPHYLGNRALFTSTYISGRRLERQNHTNNARRIVVRNLPLWFQEADLKRAFSHFGKVEVAYVFCTHCRLQEMGEALPPTGSVQFFDVSLAEKLIKIKNVEIKARGQSHIFMVYPYIHNYIDIKDSFKKEREQGEYETNTKTNHAAWETSRLYSDPIPQVPDYSVNYPPSQQSQAKVRIQRKRLLDIIHKYKPCRKYYHILRSKYGSRISTEDSFTVDNLRMNKAVDSWSFQMERTARLLQSQHGDALGYSSMPTTVSPAKENTKFLEEGEYLFPKELKSLHSIWSSFKQESWSYLEPIRNLRPYFSTEKTGERGVGGESIYGHCPDRVLLCPTNPIHHPASPLG